jgi:secreted PhoX family phosphatase
VGAAALAFGPSFWRQAYTTPALPGPGPYGPLLAADANGLALPAGFTSRVIAVSGTPVAGTANVWHIAPDGGATFAVPGGGWVYVSNSEVPAPLGGAGALKFDASGAIVDSYRILDGTDSNCAGGPTPWGTWLSCEESLTDEGHVWECDPFALGQGVERPAMGTFAHEAVTVDSVRQRLYLTEDDPDGRFYRFTPTAYPDLSAGVLEAAAVAGDGSVTWVTADAGTVNPRPPGTTPFTGGEGVWFDSDHVYFTTKGDNRVWDLDVAASRLSVLYDAEAIGPDAPLTGVDNVVVAQSGDIYVAEDGGNLEIVVVTPEREVAPVVHVTNQQGGSIEEGGTELAGPAFSPDGSRLYFSSQRATTGGLPGPGITYEVTGPFRVERVAVAGTDSTPSIAPAPAPVPAPAAAGGQLAATGLDPRLAMAGLGLLGAAAVGLRAAREAE